MMQNLAGQVIAGAVLNEERQSTKNDIQKKDCTECLCVFGLVYIVERGSSARNRRRKTETSVRAYQKDVSVSIS